MKLVLIHADYVEAVWLLGKDYIKAGCKRGEADPDKLKQDCKDGDCLFWLALDGEKCSGAAVTRFMDTPNGTVCLLDSFGADHMDVVDELLPELGERVKGYGCIALRIYGRMGWLKVMRDQFTPRWVCMDKKL